MFKPSLVLSQSLPQSSITDILTFKIIFFCDITFHEQCRIGTIFFFERPFCGLTFLHVDVSKTDLKCALHEPYCTDGIVKICYETPRLRVRTLTKSYGHSKILWCKSTMVLLVSFVVFLKLSKSKTVNVD